MTDPDVAAWAGAVEACPSVACLSGTIATYLPHDRVEGLRVANGHVEVHVVGRWDTTVPDLAREVRTALAAHTSLPVSVFVDDLADPVPARAAGGNSA